MLLTRAPDIVALRLREIHDTCLTGDAGIDAGRIELLERIAEICGAPGLGHAPDSAAAEQDCGQGDEAVTRVPAGHMIPESGRFRLLPFLGDFDGVVLDRSQDVPVHEKVTDRTRVLVVNHEALSETFLTAPERRDGIAIPAALSEIRQIVRTSNSVELLTAFECYLDQVTLRCGDAGFLDALTLLDGVGFEKELRRDPSNPFTLLGAGLSQFRQGKPARGRNLLQRLAASGYPENAHARRLLASRLRKETLA